MTPPKLDLSNFEEDDVDYTLPSRRPNQATVGTTTPAATTPNTSGTPVLPARRTAQATTPAPLPSDPSEQPEAQQRPEPVAGVSARRRGVGRPRSETATKNADRPRGSTLMVDASLVPLIQQACDQHGLTRGEVFIQAIEAAWDQLPGVLKPTPVGGNLFAARPVAKRTGSREGQVAMNYRLRGIEFDRLDELVDQIEAASRSQLINAALRIHLAGTATP